MCIKELGPPACAWRRSRSSSNIYIITIIKSEIMRVSAATRRAETFRRHPIGPSLAPPLWFQVSAPDRNRRALGIEPRSSPYCSCFRTFVIS